MIDTIYRDEAIEAVCGVVIDEFDVSPTKGYEVSEKALSSLPSADSEPSLKAIKRQIDEHWYLDPPSAEAVQGWIPCSERLPDIKEHHVSDPCLVYCENGAYGFAELEENIFGQVGWDCEREDEYHEPLGEVIAWMPLPKPYKGGGDK